MAIINHTHKFVFVHVPKAAGTSVTNVLAAFTCYRDLEIGGSQFGEAIQPAYFERFGLYKHAPASRLRRVMGEDDWKSFFSFSFVRNPYERTVSVYKFLRQWEACPEKIKKIMLGFKSVNDYVLSGIWEDTHGPDEIFRPQAYWITNPDNRSEVLVDKIYKVENIENGLSDVLLKIKAGSSSVVIPKLNSSNSDADIRLNEKSIEKIEKIYFRDFNIFDYEMIGNEN